MDGVAAVVVAHDSAAVLPACLEALARDGVPVTVVDNASSDGSARVAAGRDARVIEAGANLGFGRAMNRGVAASDAPLLLLLNPDAVLDPGAIPALLAAARAYPGAALFGPRLIEPDGRVFFPRNSLLSPYLANPGGVRWEPSGDACVPFLSGACLLVRREVFAMIGGFDEAIFLFYEDDDLCRRVAEAGYSMVHVHAATVRHARGGSSVPDLARARSARLHAAWSRAYVSAKWGLPSPVLALLAASLPKYAAAALTRDRPRLARHGGTLAGCRAWLTGKRARAPEAA